jgi:AcrR family transcriptional regulator
MSPRSKKQWNDIREEKRDHILSVALRLFANNGYHSTSIMTIAREAGISKGLLYHYFESKEELIGELFHGYLTVLGSIINPDSDDEITSEEMDNFFDLLKQSLKENNEYWRLYTQLSIQPDVLQIFLEKYQKGVLLIKHQQLIFRYFSERFENHEIETFFFLSVIKGFAIQFAFAPDFFPDMVIDGFITKLKEMFIKPKKNTSFEKPDS